MELLPVDELAVSKSDDQHKPGGVGGKQVFEAPRRAAYHHTSHLSAPSTTHDFFLSSAIPLIIH